MTAVYEECRPLLEPEIMLSNNRQDNQGAATEVTPLPMKQISILLLMQLTEPMVFTVIYPFIAELVYKTGVTGGDPSKIGYYAGIIESVFFFTEGLFVLQYGRLSDRIGRRPVLIFGMFGLAISIFSFGLSKTFGGLIFTRALSGALNGNVGVTKSMFAELTDETNEAQCFALLPIVWSAGAALGPFVGGTLSNPATLLPEVFDTPFWKEYPYFLPCLVTAILTAGTLVYSVFSLEETLHRHDNPKPDSVERGTPDTSTRPGNRPPAPTIRSVLTKRACIAIINYLFLALIDIALLSVMPVMFAASVHGGGLDLSPRFIGIILGGKGIFTGLIASFFFAPFHKRFGTKRTYITGLIAFLLLVLSLPLMNALARHGMMGAMWTVMGVHLVLSCPAFMTYSCTALLITGAAPSKSSLGTLNGVSHTTVSAVRAIGPAAATSLFALSFDKGLLGGWLVYVVLVTVNIGGLIATWWLKDERRAH